MSTQPADELSRTGAKVDEQTFDWIRGHLTADAAVLCNLMTLFADQLMAADADRLCRADNGGGERVNSRNGYRGARFDTAAGTVQLRVPRLRRGGYTPGWLLDEPAVAAEAIEAAGCRAYVEGVTPDAIADLLVAVGMSPLPSSGRGSVATALDVAVAEERRRPLRKQAYPEVWLLSFGPPSVVRVRRRTARIAVSETSGHYEVLGLAVTDLDDETGWRRLLHGLLDRGLNGVAVVRSDGLSAGMRRAVQAELPEAHCEGPVVVMEDTSEWAPAAPQRAQLDRQRRVIVVRHHGRVLPRSPGSVPEAQGAETARVGRREKRRRHVAPILTGIVGVLIAIALAATWRDMSGPPDPVTPARPSTTAIVSPPTPTGLPTVPPAVAATHSTSATCAGIPAGYADMAASGQRSPWLQQVLCAAASG